HICVDNRINTRGKSMFGVYFGKYLQDAGVITEEQYNEIIEANRNARVKMGLLAVTEGYMTQAQAEEVNQLQSAMDARFGDIAVEKKYLTEEQVSALLKKQGDSYLLFIQTVMERKILTLMEIQKHLNQYKRTERFTSLDLDAMKSSDIDKIAPIFTRDSSAPTVIKDYIALLSRNMVRFVDNKVRLDRLQNIHSYTGKSIASQSFKGDYNLFIGLSGLGNKVIGEAYAKEDFSEIDEDCLDAVCEFINITNGLFASKLSQEDVQIDMLPPEMYTDSTTISSEGIMYLMPMFVYGQRVDVVICMETKWNIE
ncbi:MAG: chemotaxis protein CheX, partial [Wujia sp.]